MLDVVDKLGSVVSAVVGLLGLILSAYGLYSQRRTTSITSAPPPPPPPEVSDTLPRLHIPDRTDWVPPASELPPGHHAGQPPGYGGPLPQQPAARGPQTPRAPAASAGPSERRRPSPVLVTGLAMLGASAVLGVVTWLL